MNKRIDFNCDMGESFGMHKLGMDEEVIKYIKSKFEILDKWEMVTHPNFLIITDP